MAIIETRTVDVSQADYDAGIRVYYCTQCPSVVMGAITGAAKCLACLPVEVPPEPIDPENPPEVLPETVFEPRLLGTANYDSGLEQFMWNRETGGGLV